MNALAIKPEIQSARRQLSSFASRALTRLRTQEALRALAVVLTLSAWLLAALVLADRMFSLMPLGVNILYIWGGATALGIPLILWRVFSPVLHKRMAAVLADDRLGLHSRLSTALTLDFSDPTVGAFGDAFADEATEKLRSLQVERAFPVRVPRYLGFIIIPLLLAGACYRFIDYQDALGMLKAVEQKRKAEAVRAQVAASMEKKLEDLKNKLEEQSAENGGQYKANQLLVKAENIAKEMKEGSRDTQEALVALGAIKRELQEEREKLRDGKDFLDRLEKLSASKLNLDENDLTHDVSEALKMGDPQAAAREARKLGEKIKEALNDPNKTDEQKKKEVEQLKREVEKLADALTEDQALREGLQELSQQAMGAADFQQLQEQIKKQMEKEGKGNKKNGDDIQDKLEQIADELERLSEDNDESLTENEEAEDNALEEVEEQIDEAMQGLAGEGECKNGGGQPGGDKPGGGQQGGQKGGAKKGENGKKKMRSMTGKTGSRQSGKQGAQQANNGQSGNQNNENGNKQGQPGRGLGGGVGKGNRPYRDGDAEFEKQQVKGKMQAGAITGLSHFRGAGAKSDAPTAFVTAFTAAEQEASSSLELERIPADARQTVKDYFSKVRDGAGLPPKPDLEKPKAATEKPKAAPKPDADVLKE